MVLLFYFYNVMSALLPLIYFIIISSTSLLEFNSEILSKIFIVFSFSAFSKHASEYGYP